MTDAIRPTKSVACNLDDKEICSAVITAVMSGKQSERDDACRKLQGHILAVEAERDAREAEAEKKDAMYREQIAYSVKLHRLIEAFCHGDALPYPELYHSKMLTERLAPEPAEGQEFYCFLHQRTQDKQPWPCIYADKALAEAAHGRASAIVPVRLGVTGDK
jgi:hypothetical protein